MKWAQGNIKYIKIGTPKIQTTNIYIEMVPQYRIAIPQLALSWVVGEGPSKLLAFKNCSCLPGRTSLLCRPCGISLTALVLVDREFHQVRAWTEGPASV